MRNAILNRIEARGCEDSLPERSPKPLPFIVHVRKMYKNKSKALLAILIMTLMVFSGFAVLGTLSTASATTSPPVYPVEFQEYGLSSGVPWSATLNGITQISEINTTVFNMVNGTYSFTIATGSGYIPSVSSGSLTVAGKKIFENITFSAKTYAVTFDIALPAGTYLVVDNVPSAIGATNPVFDLTNGTHSYYVDFQGLEGYKAINGTVIVAGAIQTKTLTLVLIPPPPAYSVTFSETGLAAVETFIVTIFGSQYNDSGGLTTSGAANAVSLTTSLSNGSYSYYATTNLTGYSSPSEYGTFAISGNSIKESVAFTTGAFSAGFSETGLIAGTPWSVTFDGMTQWKIGSPISFEVQPGTYSYSVHSVSGYKETPASGSVVISAAVMTTLTFTALPSYSVTFNEIGLAPGLTWYINTPGIISGPNDYNSSTSTQITFGGPNYAFQNGTYDYAVGAPAGYVASPSIGSFTVNGKTIIINITFSSDVFSVSFKPSTIAAWSLFNVTLNGFTLSVKDSSVNFEQLNGNYSYSITNVTGYIINVSNTGHVFVNGSAISKTITFNPVKYAITFTETGLTSGMNWSLEVNGVLSYSTTSSIVVNEPNGAYPYTVNPLTNFEIVKTQIGNTVNNNTGIITVNNGTVSVSAYFGELYTTTFVETGLPSGTTWTVNILQNGNTITSLSGTGLSLSWDLLNGTYVYSVNGVSGYTISSGGSGGFVISGKSVVESVAFAPITPSTTYSVTFTESGLPTGTSWTVIFNGNTYSSTTSSITIQSIAPGTYSYSVGTVQNYTMTPSSGSVIVVQSNIGNVITFTHVNTGIGGILGNGGHLWQTLTMNWMYIVGGIFFLVIMVLVTDVAGHSSKKTRKRMR